MPTPIALPAAGPSFLNPEWLISTFGLIGILAIIFAESGLLFGFFLPGDSLLFTAGLLVAGGHYLHQPLWLVCVLVVVAAIAGDQVGYLFGKRVGPSLFRRPDSRLFKQQNVERANRFFARYGARSVVLARFVPMVRTFTPIIAGVSKMRYRTFLIYNVIGGALWGTGITVLGYFLGQIAFVRSNIEFILIGIVVLSVVPIGVQLLRSRKHRDRSGADARSADEARPGDELGGAARRTGDGQLRPGDLDAARNGARYGDPARDSGRPGRSPHAVRRGDAA